MGLKWTLIEDKLVDNNKRRRNIEPLKGRKDTTQVPPGDLRNKTKKTTATLHQKDRNVEKFRLPLKTNQVNGAAWKFFEGVSPRRRVATSRAGVCWCCVACEYLNWQSVGGEDNKIIDTTPLQFPCFSAFNYIFLKSNSIQLDSISS